MCSLLLIPVPTPDQPGGYINPDVVKFPLLLQEGPTPKPIQTHNDTGTLVNQGNIGGISRPTDTSGV